MCRDAACCSPEDQLDFSVPKSSLPTDQPICDLPSAMSRGIPQLEQNWDTVMSRLKNTHRRETELVGIVEEFDGLLGDNPKPTSMSVIGRQISHGLKQV